MSIPDQLRKPVPVRRPGFDALDDFLWEAASWEPAAERMLAEACREGTDQELAAAARRLLDERSLTEPAMVWRLIRLLSDVGELGGDHLSAGPPAGGGAGLPAGGSWPPPIPDPLGAGIPVAGRDAERHRGLLEAKSRRSGVSILCVTGEAGVGKTCLASEIVTAIAREEPARRLEVRLSTPAPELRNRQFARTPYDALLELLIQLNVPEAEIPATLDERRARYVTELAGQRPVVLIDGVIDESQVLPLLPAEAGTVVVTSRRQLPGLFGWGARYLPLRPLEVVGSRLLVQRCFQAMDVEPAATAPIYGVIHECCRGMPVPTILVSRWLAAAAKTGLALETATEQFRTAYQAAEGATDAVFGLLDEHEQAVVRALGLLRIPEADIWVVCLGTGLHRDDARAALERLTAMGLISLADSGSGQTWAMAPLVADYARAKALAPGQLTEPEFEQILGPVIGLYGRRAGALQDLASATPAESLPSLRAWTRAQWEAERDGMAAVLGLAAASAHPALARASAAAFMDAEGVVGQHPRSWHETGRYISPIVVIARAASDHRLTAMALGRLGRDAERQGALEEAAALHGAALEAARLTGDSAFTATIPAGPSVPSAPDGGDAGPAPRTATADGLASVDNVVSAAQSTSIPSVLFGTGAHVP